MQGPFLRFPAVEAQLLPQQAADRRASNDLASTSAPKPRPAHAQGIAGSRPGEAGLAGETQPVDDSAQQRTTLGNSPANSGKQSKVRQESSEQIPLAAAQMAADSIPEATQPIKVTEDPLDALDTAIESPQPKVSYPAMCLSRSQISSDTLAYFINM